jgi:hypothetical protein
MSEKELKTIESNELQPETKDVVVNQETQMIAMIERAAMNPAVDIDKMERLLTMQERMQDRQSAQEYAKAMSLFREEAPSILKTESGYDDRYRYAKLDKAISQIAPLLSKCGLSYRWSTNQGDSGIEVTCHVTHLLGHGEATSLKAAADTSGSKNSVQAIGSTVSYLQRYTLFSILGLAASDDDDGAKSEIALITEEQANEIHSLITDNDLNMGKFLAFIKQKLKCNSIEEINLNGYGVAISSIKTTIKNKEKKS